jgi:hypothetical protein
MLQHSRIRLTTPSNATELTGADLVQINGGQPGCGLGNGCGLGGSWGGGCGCGWPSWGWPSWGWGGGFGGGLRNTILINVNSNNRRRSSW